MAVKAGTAYVDFEADFSALNKAISGLAGQKFGNTLGKNFTVGFQKGTSGLGDDLGRQATKGKSQMASAGKSFGNEFANNFKASTRGIGQNISASLKQNAMRGVKAAAVGVGGAFVYTVKTAADFEQQMSSLGSVANANTKQMKAFEKQALSAGAKTKFSAKGAAEAQTELAKGGLSVKQILSGGLDAALGLAAAGEMDLADAASTTVNAMKLFNIKGKDSTKVADAFATAANATTADVSDFANALSQGGSAAKTAGLTFKGTTAWLEALASSGIKGSDAGTSLKSSLLQLASPTLKANGVMKDLNLSFFDSKGNIKSVVEISDMLRKGMGGLTKEQRIQAATTLAGSDGMRGLLALYDAGPTKMKKYEDGLTKQGTAADVAKKKQDNLSGAMENLGGSIETLAIQVGTGMLPDIRKGTEQLTDFANDVGKIFERKDLDFGEKVNAIMDKAKIRFGPMAEKIQQAIKDAHLDDKLASVMEWATPKIAAAAKAIAPVVVDAFVDGFMAAPGWAKLVATGWLFTKLGGVSALRAVGATAGTSLGTGMAAGAATSVGTGVAAGGGLRLALMRIGTLGGPIGIALATAAVLAFSPELRKQIVGQGPIKVENLKFDIPKNMVEPIGGLIGPLGDLERAVTRFSLGALGDDSQKLLSFGDAAEDTFNKLAKAGDSRGMTELATQARNMAKQFPSAAGELTKFADAVDDAARRAAGDFRDMASMGGRKMRDIKTVTANTGQAIKQSLGADTKAGKEALAKNFSGAAEAIQKSMDAGVISTATGTKQIEQYMVLALQNMGFTEAQAVMLRKGQDPYSGKAIGGKQNLTGKQRGGWIGMGAASGDSVHAMLERDEYVLNRNAVRKVGKSALDRLNFGDAPRFQRGGSVTGDIDFLPALLNALKALSADVGRSIYVQSGRRTVAEQLAQGPSTPSHPVAGPNGPHVRGIAGDITPGYEVFGSKAGKYGLGFTVMPQEPWHIQLLDAAKAGAATVASAVTAPKIQQLAAIGPNSPLRNLVQSVLNTSHAGAQALVDNAASLMSSQVAVGEAGVPSGGSATGNGADLMREISKGRGWNFHDWWALDAGETGHGTNLTNPTSTARLRGQFLDSNWGSYGPGSDPSKNPSMAEQIQSMAAYIADRYDNPTNAYHQWLGRSPHWYQRGGLISLLAPGGSASGKDKKGAKTKSKALDNILHSKTHKAKEHLSDKVVKSLADAGATDLSATMARFESESSKYGDWAARASEITDTDALQQALNAEMTARGGRSGMAQPELDRLFPAKDQDAFIQSWLRGNATFNGGIQTDWLTQQLNQLLGWRNSLIDNPPIFQKLIDAAVAAYKKLKAEIKRIEDDIATMTKKRDKAVQAQEDNHTALVDAKKELSDELKKKKPDKKRVARLTEHVEKYRAQEAAAKQDRANYNAQLGSLRGDRSRAQLGTQTLGGDDGAPGDKGDGGRIGDLNQAVTDMARNLDDVHGLGSTMARFTSPSDFQLGTLGGTILGVQNSILGITRNAARATAEEPAAGASPGEERSKDILAELLRQANLRTAVSQAQYDVFRNAPFGGIFHQGGTVPGPIGAPRMILAQGGEVVLTNQDANAGPNVSVNFANGMEWLGRFVDVRVDNQTRTQSRRSERGLPGQGSRR